jgi:NADPH-dependent curcumin reductase CurA
VVGQIAKIKGCRVVGIAGSDTKINYLVGELGFDAAFNYKSVENYFEVLHEICPDGIDVYFDNVGGAITDAVFRLLKPRARVSVCGQISLYNLERPEAGPRLLPYLLVKQARAEGFLIFQFADRYSEALQQLTEWLQAGRLKYREDIVDGLENAPRAFIGMLHGRNLGKQLIKLAVP